MGYIRPASSTRRAARRQHRRQKSVQRGRLIVLYERHLARLRPSAGLFRQDNDCPTTLDRGPSIRSTACASWTPPDSSAVRLPIPAEADARDSENSAIARAWRTSWLGDETHGQLTSNSARILGAFDIHADRRAREDFLDGRSRPGGVGTGNVQLGVQRLSDRRTTVGGRVVTRLPSGRSFVDAERLMRIQSK